MNVNEFGVVFRFGVGFDISNNTSLSIAFTKPDQTVLTVASPAVTVGNVQITTSLGTFAANQYALYTFASGDVNQSGNWSARLTYQDASPKKLISTPGTFTINP